jgi:hypothetical protein
MQRASLTKLNVHHFHEIWRPVQQEVNDVPF